jgi:hypothetical protein
LRVTTIFTFACGFCFVLPADFDERNNHIGMPISSATININKPLIDQPS